MNASDKSAISALRSCMVFTTCSLVNPRWPTSLRISESGITPMASPPPASTASASAPISPTQPPPYTRPIPRSASSLPSRCAASLYAGRIPNDEPQNTHTLLIFIRSSQKKTPAPPLLLLLELKGAIRSRPPHLSPAHFSRQRPAYTPDLYTSCAGTSTSCT